MPASVVGTVLRWLSDDRHTPGQWPGCPSGRPLNVTNALSATPSTATLPKALTDTLIELSVAAQRRAMSPGGHPPLEAAERRLLARLAPILEEQPLLTIGVARGQLGGESATTGPKHPLLRSLAAR